MKAAIPGIYYGVKSNLLDGKELSTRELFDRMGGNTGNMAFVAGIEQIIDDIAGSVPWGNPLALKQVGANTCVIPCANQYGTHCDMGSEAKPLIESAMPVVAIGLGAQSGSLTDEVKAPEGTKRWIRAMSDLAVSDTPNIAVRGIFTYRQLEREQLHNKAVPLGCPSNFLSPNPFLGQQIASAAERAWKTNGDRIAVLAGQSKWPHLKKIDASLVNLIRDGKGSFIIQDPIEMFHLARGEYSSMPGDEMTKLQNHFFPGRSASSFKRFLSRNARLYHGVEQWVGDYRNFDFVIGPRIHGVVLALQAGVPALCVAHDARTQELCEMMRIPWVAPKEIELGISFRKLRSLFRFDPYEYDRNRRNLANRYINFLESNGLRATEHLRGIGKASPPIRELPASGAVDYFNMSERIAGWTHSPGAATPIVVVVKKHGRVIGSTLADLFRPDLAGTNEGRVGFKVTCTEPVTVTELLSGAVQVVSRISEDREWEIPLWEVLRNRMMGVG